VLSDPERLRTPGGHGYLVSWKHRLRTESEPAAAAIVERILDDPANIAALRAGIGRPEATMDELAQWLVLLTLLHPHPDTGVPVINPEEGRVLRPGAPTTDALRIVVPFDTNRLELGFTVNASAPDVLKPDGPGETHGRYLLDLFHQHATMFFQGRSLVVQQIGGRAFPATDGALLRK